MMSMERVKEIIVDTLNLEADKLTPDADLIKDLDVDSLLASGDLSPITAWLGERIWRHGRSRDTAELMVDACGEAFSPAYYTDYLTEKFSALYGL